MARFDIDADTAIQAMDGVNVAPAAVRVLLSLDDRDALFVQRHSVRGLFPGEFGTLLAYGLVESEKVDRRQPDADSEQHAAEKRGVIDAPRAGEAIAAMATKNAANSAGRRQRFRTRSRSNHANSENTRVSMKDWMVISRLFMPIHTPYYPHLT